MSSSYPENLKEVRTARAGRLKHPILRFVGAFLMPTVFFLTSTVIFFIVYIIWDYLLAGKVSDWFVLLFVVIMFSTVLFTIRELYYSVFPWKRLFVNFEDEELSSVPELELLELSLQRGNPKIIEEQIIQKYRNPLPEETPNLNSTEEASEENHDPLPEETPNLNSTEQASEENHDPLPATALKESTNFDVDTIPKDLGSFLNNIEREEKFIYLQCIIILYSFNYFNENHQWLLNAALKGGHSEDIHFGDKTKWSHLARKMEFKDLRDYDLCIKEMEVHIIGNLKEYFI